MKYQHHLLLYQTVTPLHVGCGQDVGVVDLPVIRERTTGYPFIPGSGTRGAMRAAFGPETPAGGSADDWRTRLFGPEEVSEDKDRFAGSVAVHDAKLLLLPVRSTPEVYVGLTGPTALRRLARDLEAFGLDRDLPGLKPDLGKLLGAALPDDRFLGPDGMGIDQREGRVLYLEEYAYRPVEAGEGVGGAREELERWTGELAGVLGLAGELPGRVVLVSDAAFHHFCRFATVVQQHNKLSSAKTVEGTALFSTEAVPPDAVFHGLVGATEARWMAGASDEPPMGPRAVLERLWSGYERNGEHSWWLHLGGGESTGLGVTRMVRAGVKATVSAGGSDGG